MIQNYAQFIVWDLRTVIEDGKEVIKKLPISPITRYPHRPPKPCELDDL